VQARVSFFSVSSGSAWFFSIYFYFSIFAYAHYTADGHCNRKLCSMAAGRNARVNFFPFGIVKRTSHTHTHTHTRVHGSDGVGCLSALLFPSSYKIIYMYITAHTGSLTRLSFGGSKTYVHGSEVTMYIIYIIILCAPVVGAGKTTPSILYMRAVHPVKITYYSIFALSVANDAAKAEFGALLGPLFLPIFHGT